MTAVVASEYVPVATNCWFAPGAIEGLAGVTAMLCRVAAVTVKVAHVVPSLVFPIVSVARTQIVWGPGDRAPKPMARTGLSPFVVVPSPSWPEPFAPQQRMALSAKTAQVWSRPASRAVTPEAPETVTGLSASAPVPSPSSPPLFRPQQRAVPSLRRAHV